MAKKGAQMKWVARCDPGIGNLARELGVEADAEGWEADYGAVGSTSRGRYKQWQRRTAGLGCDGEWTAPSAFVVDKLHVVDKDGERHPVPWLVVPLPAEEGDDEVAFDPICDLVALRDVKAAAPEPEAAGPKVATAYAHWSEGQSPRLAYEVRALAGAYGWWGDERDTHRVMREAVRKEVQALAENLGVHEAQIRIGGGDVVVCFGSGPYATGQRTNQQAPRREEVRLAEGIDALGMVLTAKGRVRGGRKRDRRVADQLARRIRHQALGKGRAGWQGAAHVDWHTLEYGNDE